MNPPVPMTGLGLQHIAVISAHGGPALVIDPAQQQPVSGRSFANSVVATLSEAAIPRYRTHDFTGPRTPEKWVEPKAITLLSCYSAALGPVSNAQMVANATGLRVLGFKQGINPVTKTMGGKYFTPQRPITASITGAANAAIFPLTKLRMMIKNRLNAP